MRMRPGGRSRLFAATGYPIGIRSRTGASCFLVCCRCLLRERCLADHPRLIRKISQPERRTGRSGRDIIDHMNGAHDDLAVAGWGVDAGGGAVVQASVGADAMASRVCLTRLILITVASRTRAGR